MPDNTQRLILIRSAISGDPDAIEQLLEASQPDIRRYAIRYCVNREDAEDASQETLWKLYRRIGALRAVAAFPAWLMMIVRRECARLSGGHRHQGLFEEQAIERFSDDDLRIDIAASIESLPENYRMVVILRDFQNMTVDEIAAALSLSRESVKGRLHRARGLMREYLAP